MKNDTLQKLGIIFILFTMFSVACLLVLPNKWLWGTVAILSFIASAICARIYGKRKRKS